MRAVSDRVAVRVVEAVVHTHSLGLRIPFAVAGTELTEVEQITLAVTVEARDGRTATGLSADSPAPIWFDKERPSDAVHADLRASLDNAVSVYRDHPFAAAFDLSADADRAQEAWRRDRGAAAGETIPETVAAFGPSLLDRAIVDAVCKLQGVSFYDAVKANLLGVDARLTPRLAGHDLDAWLAALEPKDRIAIRHTVTGLEQLGPDGGGTPPTDGLPFFLRDVIARYGNRYFKIKMRNDLAYNRALFAELSAILTDCLGGAWAVTLDCNECFDSTAECADMLAALSGTESLAAFWQRVLYLEQPVSRKRWRDEPVWGVDKPVIIDETEGSYRDAELAFALGYKGVSAKSLKGFYKALLNAAGVSLTRPDCFVTAEDMNHPAGLAFQQDIAKSLLLGLPHAEKNGHHFIGPVDAAAPYAPDAAAYPDLYRRDGDRISVIIRDGYVRLGDGAVRAGFLSETA